ncbi:helix-turn-helix domain-containing protein [Aeoliella mucimassa]|uniref:Anaerobic benzoate catabolism transcriptional regulator n=1 Tax=Aeoliella mucimassa TaxID=2527972 RepID=A0A518AW89_9BACT|nr:helix-turn-helix transcriptional regulator [Aeoliella mucimassa]QDU59005.1 anaerobic benzoate catabolism transcriptional regulator [Aeoliella mucimassa]
MSKQLGKTIRILRQAKSLKMTEVAGESGVSVPYLSLVENGERQPSLEVMRRIAETLGVPSEALIVMGVGDSSLMSSDKRTSELTGMVGQLIEIENKLTSLLGKDAKRAATSNKARTPRRGNGPKR